LGQRGDMLGPFQEPRGYDLGVSKNRGKTPKMDD